MANPWEVDWKAEPKSGAAPWEIDWTAPAKPVDGGFMPSVKQSVGAVIKGAGQAASDFIPGVSQDNSLKRYGQSVIDANPTVVHGFEDAANNPGKTITEATGNAAGSVGGILGARALGMGITAAAPLTGPLAPVTALLGQAVAWLGPVAIASLPSYGGIRDKQILNDPNNTHDAKSKAIAALGAVTVAAIETKFGVQNWALGAMTKEGRAALAEKFAETTLAKGIGFGALKGAAIEGGEELAQNPIEQLASYDNPLTKESLKDTAFSGFMGAVGGGVLGGATGGVAQGMKRETKEPASILQEEAPVIADIAKAGSADEAIAAFTASFEAGDSVRQQQSAQAFGAEKGVLSGLPSIASLPPVGTADKAELNGLIASETADVNARRQGIANADEADLNSLVTSENRDLQVMRANMQRDFQKQQELDQLQTTGRAVAGAATVTAPNAMQLAMERARIKAMQAASLDSASPPEDLQDQQIPQVLDASLSTSSPSQNQEVATQQLPPPVEPVGSLSPEKQLQQENFSSPNDTANPPEKLFSVVQPAEQPAARSVVPTSAKAAEPTDDGLTTEDRLESVKVLAAKWFGKGDAEYGTRDYAAEYRELQGNYGAEKITPDAYVDQFDRIFKSYQEARAKSFEPTRQAAEQERQRIKNQNPSTASAAELAFISRPESTLASLSDGQLKAIGDAVGARRGRNQLREGFIEAIATKPFGDVLFAYLEQTESVAEPLLALPSKQELIDKQAQTDIANKPAVDRRLTPVSQRALQSSPVEAKAPQTGPKQPVAIPAQDQLDDQASARGKPIDASTRQTSSASETGLKAVAQAPVQKDDSSANDTQIVSTFNGKFGKGMGKDAAKLEAMRLNRVNAGKGITYAAEEHNDPKLENPYSVVGRKAQSKPEPRSTPSTRAKDLAETLRADIEKSKSPDMAKSLKSEADRVRNSAENMADVPDVARTYRGAADILDGMATEATNAKQEPSAQSTPESKLAQPAAKIEDGGPMFSIAKPKAKSDNPKNEYSPATARETDLASQLAERINANRPAGAAATVLHAVGGRLGNDENASLAAAQVFAQRLYAEQVVYVEFDGQPLFNGAVSKTIPGVIFIRVDAEKPHMAVLGHELLHKLRESNPGAYNVLDGTLTKLLNQKGGSAFLDKITAKYEKQGREVPNNWDEELWADIVGDNFTDPEFWALMKADRPGIFKLVADAVTKFLNMALTKIGVYKPFGTDAYLNDIKAAREAVAVAMQGLEVASNQGGRSADDTTPGVQTKLKLSLAEPAGGATVKQMGDKWVAVRFEGTGREQHLSYHATEQQARDAATANDSKRRLEANTRSGKFADWWVPESNPESFRSASIGRINAVDTGVAIRQTLDARVRAVKTTAQGRNLQQIPSREGFCFKCASDAAIQSIGDYVIGESHDGTKSVWHAVVMRDGMVYDPTFGKWFAPGVYEELGFKEALRLTPDQVKEFSAKNGGKSPDARNQGLGDAPGGATNPDIRFSLIDASSLNNPRDLVNATVEHLNDRFNAPGTLNWWQKSIGTQYDLAQRSAPFKKVFDSVQNFINDTSFYATEAADLAPKLIPKLETWKDIFKKSISAQDSKAIAAPIFEGTLIWKRLANGQLSKTIGEEQGGVVFTADELKQRFGLTESQIALYKEFRTATDKSLTNLVVSHMVKLGGADTLPIADQAMEAKTATEAVDLMGKYLTSLAEQDEARSDVLMNTAAKMLELAKKTKGLTDTGYAPLSRFGQYTVDVISEGKRVYFGMFESKLEANKMAKKMQFNYAQGSIRQGTVSQEEYKMFAGVTPETLALFGEMLGLDEQGGDAKNLVFQEYLKAATANRSAMKRLIHRKGIEGFSEDASRVLAGFIYSNARQTSSNLHAGDITKATADIPQGQGEVKDAAIKLAAYVQNPQEEAQALRGLMFAQYIGGSVASAMVNLTQPFTMTLPWLSQYGGIAKAGKQMASATRDALKAKTGDTKLDAALKHAEETGIVSPQEVHQLQAQASGAGSLKSGDGTSVGDAKALASNTASRIMLGWGKLFGVAEQFNRRSTFIAAYRTAVEQGMDNPAAFAEKAIAETQGVYNKGNKPAWARGAIGSTLFTFKQFSIAYVEMLGRMVTGPQANTASRMAALNALAILVLVAGVGGLPGADDLDDLISGLMQSMGYNFDSKAKRRAFLMEHLGAGGQRVLEHGLSGLPGVPIDVSGRLGLGNLIPGTGLLTKKKDHASDIAELAGPAGDLSKRAFEAGGSLVRGEFGDALNAMSPMASRNVVKAFDMAKMGMYRDQRGNKVIDTDMVDAVFKGIGFQPSAVKQVQDATGEVQRMVGLNKMRETEIADKWAQGLFEKNPEKAAEARQELMDWNADNEDTPIKINYAQIFKRLKSMNMTKAQRIEKTTPKEIRSLVRQELTAQ